MNSAQRKAERFEERRFEAEQWLKGMRELRDKVNRLSREFIEDGNRRLQEAADEDEPERIIEHCKQYERLMGAADVFLSPIRSGSLLAQSRREPSSKLVLFNEEE